MDRAIADYDKAIRVAPKDAVAYSNRGNAWMQKGELDRAIADYDEAIRLGAEYAQTYSNRGVAWTKKGELDRAIADYDKAIRLDPENAGAYKNRGIAFEDQRQYNKALADYSKVIELAPDYASAYYKRANVLGVQGQYGEALADYSKAVELVPDYLEAHNSLAWLLATCPNERFRDGDRAIKSAIRACELTEWREPDYLDTLAAAYAESGQFEKAVEFQQKALDLWPQESTRKNKDEAMKRLRLFQSDQAYRQKAPALPPE